MKNIPTFGIFMVAMALLGGKGTLWGPVLGAIIFHVVKETTWTYLLNLQWIALGLILIINIVYFQQGIMGWLQTKFPERFGIVPKQAAGPHANRVQQAELEGLGIGPGSDGGGQGGLSRHGGERDQIAAPKGAAQ